MLYQTYLEAVFEDSFLIEADNAEEAEEMAKELFLDCTAVISEGDMLEFTNVEAKSFKLVEE